MSKLARPKKANARLNARMKAFEADRGKVTGKVKDMLNPPGSMNPKKKR